MADPKKFPSGMKAIGDYIHSKGLKYGIYQDRGDNDLPAVAGKSGTRADRYGDIRCVGRGLHTGWQPD